MSQHHVAVVAVHGVADQAPSESAREVAALLQRPRSGAGYSAFQETPLRISTAPVVTAENPSSTPSARVRSPDHEFMRQQIAEYESPREPYETVRLEGERSSGATQTGVHVYEMYWADLSRVDSGFFHILGDLYQLIFHLPHLGRLALEQAYMDEIEPAASKFWFWGIKAYWVAQRMLTLWLPLLALIIFGTLLTLLPASIPKPASAYLCAGCVALFVTLLLGFAVFRIKRSRPLGILSCTLPLVAIPMTGYLTYGYLTAVDDPTSPTSSMILSISWLGIASYVFWQIMGMLERYRPGAKLVGVTLGILSIFPSLALLLTCPSKEQLVSRIIWMAEAQLFISALPFFLFAIFGLLASLWTHVAAWMTGGAMRRRLRQAAWTARATLTFAFTFYTLASISIASAVYFAALGLLPDTTHEPLAGSLGGSVPAGPQPLRDFVGNLIAAAAGDGFPILVVSFLAFVVVLLWTLAPLILHEIRPDTSQQAREGERSERLGRWLDDGLVGVPRMIDRLFYLSMLLVPTLFFLSFVSVLGFNSGYRGLGVTQQWILWLGSAIAAFAVGLLALRSRFAPVVGILRSGIDRALDVDNYLREHPRTFTPRARIAERYTSLLRYLNAWRDRDGQPYRAIIIIAHSQGTPITADLLRFLRRETPAELTNLMRPAERRTRLYFVTMGSPLAQVYGQAFPHLYYWMNGEPSAWLEPIEPPVPDSGSEAGAHDDRPPPDPASDEAPAPANEPVRIEHGHGVTDTLDGGLAPDPRYLAVDRWVNIYRSGDYVGRAFWRRPDRYPALHRAKKASDAPDVRYSVSEDRQRLRRELCLGAGAHVHYWDATAGPVALEIDLLIAEAVEEVVPFSKATG